MSFEGLLLNTCTVSRYTTGGIDDYGHAVKTWGNHLVGQPCRLQATETREVVIGKEVVLANYRAKLGQGAYALDALVQTLGAPAQERAA